MGKADASVKNQGNGVIAAGAMLQAPAGESRILIRTGRSPYGVRARDSIGVRLGGRLGVFRQPRRDEPDFGPDGRPPSSSDAVAAMVFTNSATFLRTWGSVIR